MIRTKPCANTTNKEDCRRMKKPVSKKLQRTIIAFIFLSPALVIALVFVYYPSLYALRLSFFDWDMISPDQTYVGLDNFVRIFSKGSDFWKSLLRTLEYTVIYIPLSLISGLFLAKILSGIKKYKGFFQSIYFIPSITSISVIAIVWSYIYNPQIGPLQYLLTRLGMVRDMLPQWLNDPRLALPCLAVTGAWQSLGFVTLLFVAGMNNIPRSCTEAAEVDGASSWRIFWQITMPMLSPVTYFVIFMLVIDSFRVFGIVSIMTQGKPVGSTNVLLYYVYQNAFRFFDAGTASASSLVIFLFIFVFMLLQQKLGEKSVFYQ